MGDKMNFRRGLLRVWMVFTVFWVALWSWYYDISSCQHMILTNGADLGWVCERPDSVGIRLVPIGEVLAVVAGPSAAILLVGFLARWMIAGFQRPKSN